jgi:hypothetical protein
MEWDASTDLPFLLPPRLILIEDGIIQHIVVLLKQSEIHINAETVEKP